LADASQTAENHFCKDIWTYVTAAPLGVEVLRWRRGCGFVHRLSCGDQNPNPLSNLYQHVAVVLQICPAG
jgi:hypothetical protein